VVAVIDWMPPRYTTPDVMRLVVGKRGTVPMRIELVIRFDYGSVVPWVQRSADGIRAIAGPDTLYLHTPVPLHGEDLRTVAEFTVSAGERVPFVVTWTPTFAPVPDALEAVHELDATATWWRAWSNRCTYQGAWREDVLRSLITLKALTYAPTGGLVAAATTSLPEQLGGVRNWDYATAGCATRPSRFTP
jgi:GH15 family glucan-1,4-alpha-glucosidase